MTNEELMKPRYKVIADYPGNTTLNIGDEVWAATPQITAFYNKYPHLFKKLEWWEDREEKDMPEYLKLVFNDRIQFIHKVENWTGEINSSGQPLYEYFNKSNYLSTACVSELEPANIEEYNQYLKQ